ncbi:hypothetical protein [Francisella persica]|nr:hypothetical protein [Francisella persica]
MILEIDFYDILAIVMPYSSSTKQSSIYKLRIKYLNYDDTS